MSIFGDMEAQRTSLRVFAVRGPSCVAFAAICPLHFMDGSAKASFFIQFLAYCKLPKAAWSLADRFSADDAPTFHEMAFKNDLEGLSWPIAFGEQDIFSFEEYNAADPYAMDRLIVLDQTLSNVPRRKLVECRKKLRASGVTLTAAFSALSIQVLAIVTANLNTKKKPICCLTGVDARSFGKWGDHRDKANKLPVIGNYTFSVNCAHNFDDALEGSIVSIASQIKSEFHAIRNDTGRRMRKIAQFESSSRIHGCGVIVGVSSIHAPRLANVFGLTPRSLDAQITFGPVPRVWLYCITIGKFTKVHADVGLPIENLDVNDLLTAIQQAARGSPLEDLVSP